jgi:hypothetical protein
VQAQTAGVPRVPPLRQRGWTGSEGGRRASRAVRNPYPSRRPLERAAAAGESPVGERVRAARAFREYGGTRDIPPEAGGTTLQG